VLSNITKMVFFSKGIDEIATVKLEEAFKNSSPLRPKHGAVYYNLGNLFK
jgi:hypothetical protein